MEAWGISQAGLRRYATSKQGNLATVFTLAREVPRLRFNAVEPGFSPGSGLGRDASPVLQFVARYLLSPLAPLIKYWSTPKRAARVLIEADTTGVYYDENGAEMQAPKQVSDQEFSDRYISETRALLATVPADRRSHAS